MTEELSTETAATPDENQQSLAPDEGQQSLVADEGQQSLVPDVQRRLTPPAGVTWLDQDEQLRTMWVDRKTPEEISAVLGRSVAAIMTRAARLSLPRRAAPGRKRGYKRSDLPKRKATPASSSRVRVRAAVHDTTEEEEAAKARIKSRVCLMCLNKFQSLGSFNRICPSCKGSADFVKGSSTPDFNYKVMG